jgi:ribonuclease-3
MEAVIGAVYVDRGLPAAEELVLRLFAGEFEQASDKTVSIDYKSKLQEVLQGKYHKAPAYVLSGVTGPEQQREFTVEARLEKKVLGEGTGRSKKSAEAEAARDALERLEK